LIEGGIAANIRPGFALEVQMSDDVPPDRGVGIRFNGAEKTNVEEYCVSEGWVRVAAGKTMDRFGQPMTIKLKGTVEPYFRHPK
jgi:hypothetical protein